MPPDKTFPLSRAPVGQKVRLVHIHGGRQLTHRLVEMGLTPGVIIRVLQNSGGPLLVAESDSRIAVGRGMAEKIDVSQEVS
ncbi:MAG: FeoA family protein [Anaerolineales bacterium]|jgi:ferrous iron transport protein A